MMIDDSRVDEIADSRLIDSNVFLLFLKIGRNDTDIILYTKWFRGRTCAA